MYNVLSYVFLATSILLFLFTVGLLKTKKALERELLTLKDRPPDETLKNLQNKALIEIEQLKNSERQSLDEELREKRRQNEVEITEKKASIDRILEDYKKSEKSAIGLNFAALQQEMSAHLVEQKQKYEDEILETQGRLMLELAKLEELRTSQIEATEALRREAILKDEFHLNIVDSDKIEIEELKSIANKYARIRPIILEAIYKIYYTPEIKKLVSRVVGKDKISGIYRITCRKDGRIYIGKSVDIAIRWATHFKRAAGVENETTNLLYPAMRAEGLDQFSFEIIEKVTDETKLGEREKYWQTFYDAKSHGFSVR
jgi:hypothetical protein